MDDHDGPGQPCEGEKIGDQDSHQGCLPGAPNAEFLLDKSLCRLGKKAERIATEINARVLAWGGRRRLKGRKQTGREEEDRPFTRDAPTSRLVGTRNLSRKDDINDQSTRRD